MQARPHLIKPEANSSYRAPHPLYLRPPPHQTSILTDTVEECHAAADVWCAATLPTTLIHCWNFFPGLNKNKIIAKNCWLSWSKTKERRERTKLKLRLKEEKEKKKRSKQISANVFLKWPERIRWPFRSQKIVCLALLTWPTLTWTIPEKKKDSIFSVHDKARRGSSNWFHLLARSRLGNRIYLPMSLHSSLHCTSAWQFCNTIWRQINFLSLLSLLPSYLPLRASVFWGNVISWDRMSCRGSQFPYQE